MERHKIVLALVIPLVLAGCLGVAMDPSDSNDVSPEQVPGVTNGTLSNTSALVEANQHAVTSSGAVLLVNQSSDDMDLDTRMVIGANFSTYSLSVTRATPDGQSATTDQWSNETTLLVRTASDNQTTYRVLDRPGDRPRIRASVYELLSAGSFDVANETPADGSVVLTSDRASPASSTAPGFDSFDGRLVVNESGQIQQLSINITQDGESVTFRYQLRRAGIDSAPKPDWTDDVPPSASVQADLSVDVENDSYLTLRHTGGDTVPSATTVRVESNETVGTVSLDSSFSVDETRYVYFDRSSGSLRVTADRPEPSTVSPVTSPVSVRIATDGGAVLHSGSMAWDSERVSDNATSSSGRSMSTNETASQTRSDGSER